MMLSFTTVQQHYSVVNTAVTSCKMKIILFISVCV